MLHRVAGKHASLVLITFGPCFGFLSAELSGNIRVTRKSMFARPRVIALAYKKLDEKLSPVDIGNMPREEIESGLDFAAFAIFQCPLKEESEPALRMLKVRLPSLFIFQCARFACSCSYAVGCRVMGHVE